MNSRMNFGGGFSIPLESGCQIGDTGISITPDKLIEVRSHPIPMERQGNQLGITNWQELVRCSNLNYTGEVSKSQDFRPNRLTSLTGGLCNWDVSLNEKNHIAGSYSQAFSTDSAGWNYNTLAVFPSIANEASGFPSIANESSMASEKHLLNRSILVENMSLNASVHSQVNRNAASLAFENSLLSGSIHGMHIPLNPNCHSQVNSNWRESNFASPFLTRHSDCSDSSAWSNSLIQTPQCGFRVPFQPDYNLNSPRIKANLDELLQNIVESSSTTIAVSFKEKNNDRGSDLGIDLNKTPRQIATKRRKHRPKVIIEGKPKTTPKPRTQNPLSKENRLGKRKYVRKNGHTPKADIAGLTKDPAVRAVAKSRRRVLNFDLERTADESQGNFDKKSEELQHRVTLALNLNSDSHDTKLFNETDSSSGEKSVLHTGRWNGVMVENQQAGTTHKFIHSMNQMPTDYVLLPEWRVPPVSPATMKNLQVEKLKGVLSNVNTRYAGTSLHSYKKGSSSEFQQIHEEGSGQQAKTTHGNLERTRQPSSLQSMLKNVADSSEARGSKRGYSDIIEWLHPRTVNMINSSLMCQERFQGPEYDSNDSYLGKGFSETHKKKKTENGPCTNICSILSCVAAAEDDSHRPKMKGGNEVNASQVTSQISQGMLNSYFESSNTPKNLNNEFNKFTSERYSPSAVGHNFPNQQSSSEPLSYGEMMGEKRSNRFTQVRDFPSQAATEKDTFLSLSPIKRAPPSVDGQEIETFCTNTSTKKQTVRHTVSSLLASSKDEVLLLELKEVHGSQQSSTRKGPSKRQKSPLSIDDVISQMKDLNLNCRSNAISGQQKNALVPYKGDGNIVPYEGFDHMKKHGSRPKVDLDPETDRIWKLLMGKEGSESTEGTDKDKEKWWEGERNVFRGRADSFIARMHLVQGDRRFSKWKGSVVDSLIGVFLTQNVSDHLSSSAFMSLVARFPRKSAINNTTCYKEGKSLLVKEREVCILDLDENIGLCGGVSSQPDNNNQSSVTCLSLGTKRKTFVEAHNWRVEEEIISPLDLLSSCILQDDGGIHSFSNLQTDKTAMFQNKRIGQATVNKIADPNSCQQGYSSSKAYNEGNANILKARKTKVEGKKKSAFDWDVLRKQVQSTIKRERSKDSMDSLDYEALRCADVHEISNVIKERGMHNMLAERIKDFLNRLVTEHGSIDLEWLRDAPPDKTKDYLLSIRGLGLKSVECVRLLTLHHLAFPVDTNVGRIAVRLGWVPLQPLPESLQLHLLELYPILESIQKYLWPRLCKLDQQTLYELHYQLITFGKVFCTKNNPNCNYCPMRGECRHFASAFASARLALPGPEEKSIVSTSLLVTAERNPAGKFTPMLLPASGKGPVGEARSETGKSEPIIEVPATPEPECLELSERDIEDGFYEDRDEIPIIEVNYGELVLNIRNCMRQNNLEVEDANISKALVALTPEAASIPTAKLKNVSRLRTEHEVYELPDSHPLLKGLERRELDDPSPYLLAIWTPGETANSTQPPERCCEPHESNKLCNKETCFSCNSIREANSQIVRGTLLIPCRTAMKGSFPLNGTYFQVNEVFADHDSSQNPIEVPRAWIWNLNRRTVFFGSSVSAIFRGLSTEAIQSCFWRGFICVRGFERTTGAPRPLLARLHLSASKRPSRTRNQRRP